MATGRAIPNRRRWIIAAVRIVMVLGTGMVVWLLTAPFVSAEARAAALAALEAELGEIPAQGTLIVVDYSRPSQVKRLGVLDLATGAWVSHARVTHGKNSGLVYARDLSDEPGSLKSPGGLFAVAEEFDGIHGASIRLEGLEPGVNGNAEERGIIVHAAEYAGVAYVFMNWRELFRLGRSEGCFALAPEDFARLRAELNRPAYLYAYR
jgi:hypothetical protein